MKSRMKDTLLLIGDSNSDRAKLHDIFESNFYLLEAESVEQGIMLLGQNSSCIAAVLADIPLGDGSALKALTEACHPNTEHEIPVISIIVPVSTGEREEYAFLLGCADVVLKPYTTLSVQRRVQVLVDLYAHRWHLEKLVEEQNQTIRNANQSMLDTLSAVIEHRSTESGNHVLRIRRFTQRLLQELAVCFPEYALNDTLIDTISSAAVLHDIGKISIPDAILNKPGKLTEEEREIMKTHTSVGSELVSQLQGMGDEMYLRYIYNISLYHHERWDGNGYPAGLKGDEIPICAQVVGLADAFDALTTQRVYKPAIAYTTAANMILNGECGVFSPKLLECFKRARQSLFALARQYADGYSPKSDDIQIPLPGPELLSHPVNALQLSQLKYQTLLHHTNDTVVELDLDNRIYHMVYNPNPDFTLLLRNDSLEEFFEHLLHESVHPEDVGNTTDIQSLLYRDLFQQNLRKRTIRCRLFSPAHNRYSPYEITVLRVNTENPSQRILLVVFHATEELHAPQAMPQNNPLADYPVLFSMMNGILRCDCDDALTIRQGINTLFPLTGFSAEEVRLQFAEGFLNLVAEEDREPLRRMLHSAGMHHSVQEVQVRLLHRSGTPTWILCKCRAHIGPDGKESLYMNLSDISSCKARQAELEATIDRNRTILSLSESVVFEWNLRNDTVSCSEKWQTLFGYTENPSGFLNRAEKASLFHPDDLPLVRSTIGALLRQEKASDYMDVRIVNASGRYLWSRIRATVLPGEDGKPAYIMGIIYDINELKANAMALKQQAERDSLTKLLNRASTQQSITAFLDNREDSALAAMLVLDLDNFKTVNDTHGHLYGDAVLTQISATLRSLFRSQDVIGRIGGDEFLIFLKNIPSVEIVLERCELLVNTFRSQLQTLMPGLSVSVSIGCAISPRHGSSYADLFRHADEALYNAKRKGKNQYSLYNPQEKYDILMDTAAHTTRIDSDEQPSMNEDSLLRYVFRLLYESRDIDSTIQNVIAFIGSHFNVSRVYIFENNDDNTCCSNTFEWCNEGISPEKENLQNISYITDIPGWPNVYNERGVLYCTDVTQLEPAVREILEPQGIKSMLHCAIMDRGVFRGYVGFDECTANYLWTQGQVSTLEFMAELLAVFLIKQRALDKYIRSQNTNGTGNTESL